mmetsp:Transcript_7606/g.17560  ORF Transcript_7606/g.17560 Transcript_7606/m.17560 type:complete len:226 (-) Transcript_7606:9-686(-)
MPRVRGGDVQERGGECNLRDVSAELGILFRKRGVPVLAGVHGGVGRGGVLCGADLGSLFGGGALSPLGSRLVCLSLLAQCHVGRCDPSRPAPAGRRPRPPHGETALSGVAVRGESRVRQRDERLLLLCVRRGIAGLCPVGHQLEARACGQVRRSRAPQPRGHASPHGEERHPRARTGPPRHGDQEGNARRRAGAAGAAGPVAPGEPCGSVRGAGRGSSARSAVDS